MGQKWKLTLPIALNNGVDYLVLEHDPIETGGFFVYYLNYINLSFGSDEWYASFDNALNVATEFGLYASDWQLIESDGSNG